MKKLLIFDLDGTLLDTLMDLTNSVNFALKQFGYKEKSKEFVRKAIGNGVAILIARCIENGKDNSNYQNVLNCFRSHYKEHYFDNTIPYDGMKDLLIALKSKRFSLAVVSNKIDFIAKSLINHFFPNIFDYVQGDVSELKKKPHPDMVNHVLKELHRRRQSVCYIGDTNVDYETAVHAKMDVLLVTYGYRAKEEMKEYNISAPMVDSVKEIGHYFISK